MGKSGGTILKIARLNPSAAAKKVSGLTVAVVGWEKLHPRLTGNAPAQGTAGTAQTTLLGEVLASATVTGVTIIPSALITGVATNNRKFAIVNKGQNGSGTTEIASITFAAGTNAAALVKTTVPISGTAGNLAVATGDVLAIVETINGTGLAHGGARFTVTVA